MTSGSRNGLCSGLTIVYGIQSKDLFALTDVVDIADPQNKGNV